MEFEFDRLWWPLGEGPGEDSSSIAATAHHNPVLFLLFSYFPHRAVLETYDCIQHANTETNGIDLRLGLQPFALA